MEHIRCQTIQRNISLVCLLKLEPEKKKKNQQNPKTTLDDEENFDITDNTGMSE